MWQTQLFRRNERIGEGSRLVDAGDNEYIPNAEKKLVSQKKSKKKTKKACMYKEDLRAERLKQ
jgi:hypothetical protein